MLVYTLVSRFIGSKPLASFWNWSILIFKESQWSRKPALGAIYQKQAVAIILLSKRDHCYLNKLTLWRHRWCQRNSTTASLVIFDVIQLKAPLSGSHPNTTRTQDKIWDMPPTVNVRNPNTFGFRTMPFCSVSIFVRYEICLKTEQICSVFRHF